MPWDPDLSWPIQSTSWQLLHLLSTSYCHWWHTHFLSSRPLFGVLLHLILHLILWLHTPSNNKHNLCGFSYLNTISQTTSKCRIITARKRSLRRLCFYTCVSVILFTEGEYLNRYPPGRYTHPGQVHPPGPGTPPGQVSPPGPGTPPSPDQVHPQDQVHPMGPGTPPWDQVHPPKPGTPPGTRDTPHRPGTPPWPGTPPSSACWEIQANKRAVRILLECILVYYDINLREMVEHLHT